MKKTRRHQKPPVRGALSEKALEAIAGGSGRSSRGGDDDDGPIIIISPDGP